MRWFTRWYGANPLHLLAMVGCFALAWYAGAGCCTASPSASSSGSSPRSSATT